MSGPVAVELLGRTFALHRSAQSMDQLLDQVDDGRDPRMPYWAHLWPAALGLARHVLEQAPLAGRALELGCGLGLAGLAAAAAGLDVTLTDVEPRALALAADSARDSGLSVRTELLDWRVPLQPARHDLVLGADLLYEEGLHEPLLALLPRVVAPGGRILLADPCRSTADPFYAKLHDLFTVTTLRFPVRWAGESHRVTIFELVPD